MPSKIPDDLAAYLDAFPPATRKILNKIRATVRKAAPDAGEQLSYGVGAFKRDGTYVLYYAGYAKHVAIYPVYKDESGFDEVLRPYIRGKATARFPLDKAMPYDLITRIVRAKVTENEEQEKERAKTRSAGRPQAAGKGPRLRRANA